MSESDYFTHININSILLHTAAELTDLNNMRPFAYKNMLQSFEHNNNIVNKRQGNSGPGLLFCGTPHLIL